MSRKRGDNFTNEEKKLILNFISKNKDILENKSNNTDITIKKRKKWEELAAVFNADGKKRDWTELRNAYQRYKVIAKKNISHDKKMGAYTVDSPRVKKATEIDYLIQAISPEDFAIDENTFDSDPNSNLDLETTINQRTSELKNEVSTNDVLEYEEFIESGFSNATAKFIIHKPINETLNLEEEKEIGNVEKKRGLTTYEEELLKLQEKKFKQSMELEAKEHQIKMEILKLELEEKKLRLARLQYPYS